MAGFFFKRLSRRASSDTKKNVQYDGSTESANPQKPRNKSRNRKKTQRNSFTDRIKEASRKESIVEYDASTESIEVKKIRGSSRSILDRSIDGKQQTKPVRKNSERNNNDASTESVEVKKMRESSRSILDRSIDGKQQTKPVRKNSERNNSGNIETEKKDKTLRCKVTVVERRDIAQDSSIEVQPEEKQGKRDGSDTTLLKAISAKGASFLGGPPEIDYDISPTKIFMHIELSEWKECIERAEKHPDEVKTWVFRLDNSSGQQLWMMLPIHAAIIAKAPIEVVKSLLKAHPGGAKERDDKGHLPIHLAADNFDPDDDILKVLLDVYPKGCSKISPILSLTDYDVKCPQLYKLIEEQDWKGAKRRAKYYPSEAMKWVVKKDKVDDTVQMKRNLPLHLAVMNNAPKKVITALLRAFPVGVKCVNDDGMIPLRLELEKNEKDDEEDLVPYLLKETLHPHKIIKYGEESATKHALTDHDQNCPELYKMIKKREWDKVLNRVTTNPEEAQVWVQKKEGNKISWRHLPLHAALIMKSPYFVVEALLTAYYNSIRCCDDKDLLPLQIALNHFTLEDEAVNVLLDAIEDKENVYMRDPTGCILLTNYNINLPELYNIVTTESWEVAIEHVKMFPEEAKTWTMRQHADGTLWWRRLPIHEAILRGCPCSVVEALIEAYPDGIHCNDNQDMSPLELAEGKFASGDIIDFLLNAE